MKRRKDKGLLNSAGTFSLTYNLPYRFIKFAWRKPNMGDISILAQKRLAFLEFNKEVKDVSLTCKLFKISRQTFYKWKKRFDLFDLSSLEDYSKAPKNRRKGIFSLEKELKLKRFRENHIKQGKVKLSIMYEREYGEKISSWQFQKVIQKYSLYYDKARAKRIRTKKNKNRRKKKIRINEVKPQDYISKARPFFFCTDTIVLYLPWGKRYILTAIDHFNRLGFARTYTTKSSLSAFDFLLRLNMLVDGRIAAILSDNGGEFSKYFEEACKKLKIAHIYTRARTPKDNPKNERFNRTVKEEFIQVNEVFEDYLAYDDLADANRELTKWLIFYNFKRPHQALDYQVPIEYINNVQRVSGMYPSSTGL